MARTFEYQPDGSYYVIEDDAQNPGSLIIHRNQDVSAAVAWATKMRNSGINDYGGLRDKQSDMKHYAVVSAGAQMKMLKDGIDFWNKDQTKEMIQWIERNAPKCKVTNRRLAT